jgi:hypothetical protein
MVSTTFQRLEEQWRERVSWQKAAFACCSDIHTAYRHRALDDIRASINGGFRLAPTFALVF